MDKRCCFLSLVVNSGGVVSKIFTDYCKFQLNEIKGFNMIRRDFLKSVGFGTVAIPLAGYLKESEATADKSSKRPNIVFILTEDMRHDDIGINN